MSSKLFHAVVGFGIALGAASVGCSAAPDEGASDTAAAVTSNETQADPAKPVDKFCEVGWPTTKGGPRPTKPEAQACIDPDRKCGAYPGHMFDWPSCFRVDAAGKCGTAMEDEGWQICKTVDQSSAWTCPAGTVLRQDCPVDPAPPPANDPAPANDDQQQAAAK